MEGFWAIVAKYWVEFVFGLVGAGITALIIKLKNTYGKGRKVEADERKNEIIEAVKTVVTAENQKIQQSIGYLDTRLDDLNDEFTILKNGVLSTQGREFKDDCRRLLEEDHHITLKEFEYVQKEHHIYNSLGGNSDGDELFHLVQLKFESEFTD